MKTWRYYLSGGKQIADGEYSSNGWEPPKIKALYQKPGEILISDNASTFERLIYWDKDKTIKSLELIVINKADRIIGTYKSNLNVLGDNPSNPLEKDERRYEYTIHKVILPYEGEYKLVFVMRWDENPNDGSAVFHNQGFYETYVYKQIKITDELAEWEDTTE